MMSALPSNMAFFGPMSDRSSIAILIAASGKTALHVSGVAIVATNICWHLGWSEAEITLQRDKRRHFCPSCHQKRVVEFGEWLCEEVLKAVPHRHFTFSIPKILRRYFLYDRSLLSGLSGAVRLGSDQAILLIFI